MLEKLESIVDSLQRSLGSRKLRKPLGMLECVLLAGRCLLWGDLGGIYRQCFEASLSHPRGPPGTARSVCQPRPADATLYNLFVAVTWVFWGLGFPRGPLISSLPALAGEAWGPGHLSI